MTLTISMPVYNTPQRFVDMAVGSLMAQTEKDWRLVVVNDGGEAPILPQDERIRVLGLGINRGRYYADAVTLRATESEWWTPHDSDDWSSPHRLECLLSMIGKRAAATSPFTMTHLSGRYVVHDINRKQRSEIGTIRVVSRYTAGIYRTDVARELGGPHPEARGSYDTTFTALLWDAYEPAVYPEPLYHVMKREGSLTTHPDTRLATDDHPHSDWRIKQKKIRKRLYLKATKQPKHKWAKVLRAAPAVEAMVDADADRLRALW